MIAAVVRLAARYLEYFPRVRPDDERGVIRPERYERWREEDRQAREQHLLSGADCKWTQLRNSVDWHCRTNGRAYRLSPTKDKMWTLHRVASIEDEGSALIGKYQRRGDASKVVAQIAYQPELRW